MTETRWTILDPQNRIRRIGAVEQGTVNVELVLPGDDPAAIQSVEDSAAQAGVELQRVIPATEAAMLATARRQPTVVVDGIEYRPFG